MATNYNTKTVTDGLVLCLDAANPRSYPGTGNTWFDISGNGNHSTIQDGTFTGSYFESVGSNPDKLLVTTPSSTSLSDTFSVITGGWSIEEIILVNDATYPESVGGTVVGQSGYGSGQVGFDWNHGVTNINLMDFGVGNNVGQPAGYDVRSTMSIIDTQNSEFGLWMVRCIYWDRSNDQLGFYLNGKFQGVISLAAVSGQSIYAGGGIRWGELYGWQHDGYRASMKVYNRVLTAEEVKQNFQAFRGRYGL